MDQVAAIQMVSCNSTETNLASASHLIERAALSGAKLVVLPENFAAFGQISAVKSSKKESSTEGPIRAFLAEQARKWKVWLVGGTIPLPANDRKLHAASFVISPDGVEVGCYNKIHLFDVQVADAQSRYNESAVYEPGSRLLVVHTPIGIVGVAVCYDLRFPELFRVLASYGVEILCLPAAFTQVTGEAHWEPLLRARAIENQVYIVAANQGGVHSEKRTTYGHSMVVDPWGRVLDEIATGEGVASGSVDLCKLEQIREQIPVFKNQRIMTPESPVPVDVYKPK